MGQGAGLARDKSAAVANTMTSLAADAASFYNVPMATALEKIRAGLAGEAEPLRQFGVLLSETAVKNEAVAMGWARSGQQLDDATKTMARASLITKGLGTASGDLQRTMSSPANAMRRLSGQMENFSSDVGQVLLPALSTAMATTGELLASITESFQKNQAMFMEWGGGLTSVIETVSVGIRNFGAVWEIASLTAQEKIANLLAYLDEMLVDVTVHCQGAPRDTAPLATIDVVIRVAASSTAIACQPGSASCQLVPQPPLDTEIWAGDGAPLHAAITPVDTARAAVSGSMLHPETSSNTTRKITAVRAAESRASAIRDARARTPTTARVMPAPTLLFVIFPRRWPGPTASA